MSPTKIMIVEDNTTVAEDCRESLESIGYDAATIVASGEESIERAELERPDIVLMDIHLRDKMNGIEAAENIYSRFNIPIVFLSAYSDKTLLQQAMQVGGFSYLVKPFEERELYATLEMTLYKAKAENERRKTKEALEKSLQENKNLLSELQHRAKNSFSMIYSMIALKEEASTSDEAKKALSELNSRIRAVSEMYDQLYSSDSTTEIQIDEYLNRIASSLPGISKNISLKSRLISITVPARIAIPIGVSIVELITNAIKHAFPDNRNGMITLSLEKTNTGALLEVRDDGIGFPEERDISTDNSMGLQLVHAMAHQIGGTIKFEERKGKEGTKGTWCAIEFPI